jgi:hypothetical protein
MKLIKWSLLVASFFFLLSCEITDPDDEVAGEVSINIEISVEGFIWGDDVVIVANSTNIDKVEKVQFFIDDEMKLEDNFGPDYIYPWDTSNILYGEHIVRVTAFYDNDTQDSETETFYFSPCPIFESDVADISGITETDAQGNLIIDGEIDSDDWFTPGRDPISFGPAYPNPTSQSCFIPFELDDDLIGTMIIINRDFEIIATLFDDENPDDDYVLWSAPANVSDLYRVIFHVSDDEHWHGDLLVE